MPSKSIAQQHLMGMAYAYKKGELKSNEISSEVKELADSMTLQQLKDFASTKHYGLPLQVKENIVPANITGMGPVSFPTGDTNGSGDVPAESMENKHGDKDARKYFDQAVKEVIKLKLLNSKVGRQAAEAAEAIEAGECEAGAVNGIYWYLGKDKNKVISYAKKI